MDNEEVIKWLKYIKDMYSWSVNCDKSLDIAIKTLEQEQNAWDNVLNELELYANHKLAPVSFEQCIAIDRCINIIKTSLKSV